MEDERSIVDKTAVVIPSFNAEKHLGSVIEGVVRYIPRGQVIVVDDGSVDGTYSKARDHGVLTLKHAKNIGKGAALRAGVDLAMRMGMDYVITIDADGQHNPNEIPRFLDHQLRTGADIIIGNRMANTKGMPLIRIFTNRTTSLVVSLKIRKRLEDSQSGYRMMKTGLLRRLSLVTKRYETESEILIKSARIGAKIESIPVETIYEGAKSAIHPVKDTLRFFRMVFKSMFW